MIITFIFITIKGQQDFALLSKNIKCSKFNNYHKGNKDFYGIIIEEILT